MSVHLPSPPVDVEPAAQAGLDEVRRVGQLKTAGGRAFTESAPGRGRLVTPHEVRNVGLDAVVARTPLADSPVTGWRYFVELPAAGAVASAEVVRRADSSSSFAELNEGPFVAATADALEAIRNDATLQRGDFEIRLLRIPALYIVAWWLKDVEGDDDKVVPVAPTPNYLQPGRIYGEDEFLAALEEPARQRLSFDDTPRPGR